MGGQAPGAPSMDEEEWDNGAGQRSNRYSSNMNTTATSNQQHPPANGGRPHGFQNGDGHGGEYDGDNAMSSDARPGRSMENGQDQVNSLRESRARNNASAGAKSSSGTLRICKKCGEPLTGQFVRALGGTFHLDCFKCAVSLIFFR